MKYCVNIWTKEQIWCHVTSDSVEEIVAKNSKLELATKNIDEILTRIIKKTSTIMSKTSTSRSSHQRCSIKKAFLKILQNSQKNTCVRVSFLIKLLRQTISLQIFERLSSTSFTQSIVSNMPLTIVCMIGIQNIAKSCLWWLLTNICRNRVNTGFRNWFENGR